MGACDPFQLISVRGQRMLKGEINYDKIYE